MNEYTSPDHTLIVNTYPPYRHYSTDTGIWTDMVDVDHDLTHPAECDALKYGELCALDRFLEDVGQDDIPNLSGVYTVSYWCYGPGHNGEYDAGLTVEKQPEPADETAVV